MPSDKKPATAASALSEEWIAMICEVIKRGGHAVRGCGLAPVIEIKSLTTNRWHPMGLPGGGTEFTNYDERNIILRRIQNP